MSGSRVKVLSLYKQLLREAKEFTSYNYRTYALQRTKDAFREHWNERNPQAVSQLIAEAEKSLQIIKRQAAVGRLYESKKLVIETMGKLPVAPSNTHIAET